MENLTEVPLPTFKRLGGPDGGSSRYYLSQVVQLCGTTVKPRENYSFPKFVMRYLTLSNAPERGEDDAKDFASAIARWCNKNAPVSKPEQRKKALLSMMSITFYIDMLVVAAVYGGLKWPSAVDEFLPTYSPAPNHKYKDECPMCVGRFVATGACYNPPKAYKDYLVTTDTRDRRRLVVWTKTHHVDHIPPGTFSHDMWAYGHAHFHYFPPDRS